MKNIVFSRLIILFGAFFTLGACNNELNPVEGWKDTPVIYGFLSLSDSITYIRVERAFVDAKRSPFELAQIPDSLYYSNATVALVRVSNRQRFPLQRVDATAEGFPRKTGIFAKAPNFIYKIRTDTMQMRADEEWRIEVLRPGNSKPIAQATTKVVGNYDFFAPVNNTLFLLYDNSLTASIITKDLEKEKSARVYDVKLNINYSDSLPSAPKVIKTLTWDFQSNVQRRISNNVPDEAISFTRRGQELYQFLGNNIPQTPGVIREFRDMSFDVYAGSQEFIDYISVGLANTGITGSQTIPTYTNVEGGLGIFASRIKFSRTGLKLNDQALNLLKTGEFTKLLNFK